MKVLADLSEIAGVGPRALLKTQSLHEMGVKTELEHHIPVFLVGLDLVDP